MNTKICTIFVDQQAHKNIPYSPQTSFTNICGDNGVIVDGYEISTKDLSKLTDELQKGKFYYEIPSADLYQKVIFQNLKLQPSLTKVQMYWLGRTIKSFIDMAGTATNRASFYNTKQEQEQAQQRIHQSLLNIDRGLYGLMLALSGTTDYARQSGIVNILSQRQNSQSSLLTEEQEKRLLVWLLRSLPVTRMLKLFVRLKTEKVNNSRTRKLVLTTVLSEKKLELWATRYRRKLKDILVHAWGKRTTSIIRSILLKPASERDNKERSILRKNIDRYSRNKQMYECVGFILGLEENLTQPLLVAYHNAKEKLEAGSCLSYETLEGLRSSFHPQRSNEDVLKLTKKQLTHGQKMVLQRKAKEAKVEVKMDLSKYDAIKLYLYAFECGMTDEILEHLTTKAKLAAKNFPVSFQHVGVLIDTSLSMAGHGTQALRPISIALATRDLLEQVSTKTTVVYSQDEVLENRLVRPCGGTALADKLLVVLKEQPDAIFILSDGYENTPAGRLAEVVSQVRKLGIDTPIYQISPVFASETEGVRSLSDELCVLPVSQPNAMGVTLLKGMLHSEPLVAINQLLQLALPNVLDKEKANA